MLSRIPILRSSATASCARCRIPVGQVQVRTAQRGYARVPIMDEELDKLNELLEKFKDPASHYHIAPGTRGPVDEDDHSTSRTPEGAGAGQTSSLPPSISSVSEDKFATAREEGKAYFEQEGYDDKGILEWPVAWGDCDMFQHVNNVRFVRWIESARIQYAQELDLPEGMVLSMLSGKGTGFILKDVSLKYIRPVTWPDSVMIASRAHEIKQERASFKLKHAIWSLKDNRLAAIGDSTMVMYDYDKLQKGIMTDQFRQALEARIPK